MESPNSFPTSSDIRRHAAGRFAAAGAFRSVGQASGGPCGIPCADPMTQIPLLEDETLLDRLQHAAFDYFLHTVNPDNGLVADTSRDDSPVSIAVVGFALSAYTVAVERGWMKRAAAIQRCLAALRFFRDSDQSGSSTATGFKGFYYHFLDIRTGARVWRSELSMVDTALL